MPKKIRFVDFEFSDGTILREVPVEVDDAILKETPTVAEHEELAWDKFTKEELKQIKLYASMASGSLEYFRDNLTQKLLEWREVIKRLNINENSPCPAGGRYYYFENPSYLTQFRTNIEALEYLVKKLHKVCPIPPIIPMKGNKEWLVWAESVFGQEIPSRLIGCTTRNEALNKAKELSERFPHVYLIRVAEVYEYTGETDPRR